MERNLPFLAVYDRWTGTKSVHNFYFSHHAVRTMGSGIGDCWTTDPFDTCVNAARKGL